MLQLLLALGVIVYWTAWYLAPELVRSRAPGAPDYPIYMAFEAAFPLPDTWVALAALLGAAGLWRRRAWGLCFTLLAAGAGVFLGLIDLLYDLEHSMLAPLGPDSLVDLVIVAGLLLLCPWLAGLAWSQRRLLVD
jgi:hypothetical protein